MFPSTNSKKNDQVVYLELRDPIVHKSSATLPYSLAVKLIQTKLSHGVQSSHGHVIAYTQMLRQMLAVHPVCNEN